MIDNYVGIIFRRIKLIAFTFSYRQASVIFPMVLAAPSFFAKKITLGALQQTSQAFGQVQSSLSFFVDSYTTLAAYKANTIRLGSFRRAMTKAEALEALRERIAAAAASLKEQAQHLSAVVSVFEIDGRHRA